MQYGSSLIQAASFRTFSERGFLTEGNIGILGRKDSLTRGLANLYGGGCFEV